LIKTLIRENEDSIGQWTIGFAYRQIARYLYRVENNFAGADSLFKEVIEIRTKEFGYYSLEVKNTYNSLGVMHGYAGDAEKSIKYLSISNNILDKIMPKDSPEFVQSLSNLAAAHVLSDSLEKALPLLDRALRISEAEHGDEATLTMEVLIRRGDILTKLGRLDEAERVLKRVVETRRRTEGGVSIKTGNAHAELASLYTKRGSYTKAVEERRNAIAAYRAVYNAEKYERGSATHNDLVERYTLQYSQYVGELEALYERSEQCQALAQWSKILAENPALEDLKAPPAGSLDECDMPQSLPMDEVNEPEAPAQTLGRVSAGAYL
jgi:tetratricopeptide (TPR) repeat protein